MIMFSVASVCVCVCLSVCLHVLHENPDVRNSFWYAGTSSRSYNKRSSIKVKVTGAKACLCFLSGSDFRMPRPDTFIFGVQIISEISRPGDVYEGHRVKVKATGAKKRICISLPLIERQSYLTTPQYDVDIKQIRGSSVVRKISYIINMYSELQTATADVQRTCQPLEQYKRMTSSR